MTAIADLNEPTYASAMSNTRLQAERSPNLSVAIIEDNEADALLLSVMLEKGSRHNWRIERYSRLDDFLTQDSESPDVVFLDRHLPCSGLSESRIPEIRSRHAESAVILYTGHLTPSLKSGAAHFGAFGVIEKGSLDPETLSRVADAAAMVGTIVS